jgi:hypothetical protein
VFVLILLATPIFALPLSPTSHYLFNNDYADTISGNTMLAIGSGTTFNATAKLGSHSLTTDGSGGARNSTPTNFSTGNINHTMMIWAFIRDDDTKPIMALGTAGAYDVSVLYAQASAAELFSGGIGGADVTKTTGFNKNTWEHHAIVYYSNRTKCIYLNATLAGCGTIDGDLTIAFGGIAVSNQMSTGYGNGMYDDYRIYWNYSASQADIALIYNGGAGTEQEYPTTPSTDIDFTITDYWNGSSINSFTIDISWLNGSTTTHSTTNGTVSLVNISYEQDTTINVTYRSITNYYNATLTGESITANVSNTVTTTTYQSILNLDAQEKISEDSISGGTFYIGSNSTTQRFNLTAATHSVVFTHSAYYNLTDSVATTALTTTDHTITDVYSSIVNISAYYANGTSLSNFGLNVTSLNHTSWSGERVETTNGTTWFYLINGTYTGLINSSLGTQTFTFTVNDITENISFYNFDMDNCTNYTQTTLNFTIRDEDTDALVNGTLNLWFNVTSDFILTPLQYNFSFSGGNYYAICVPNNTISNWTADMQAEYAHTSYDTKNYYLVDYLLNTTETAITLYLNNDTSQVTLQVRDYNDDPIEDVYIKVQTYDVGTNSYTTTEIVKTDSEGDAFAQMVLNTVWYTFILELNGEVVLQTLPTKITSTTRTFRVNLDTDYFDNYDTSQGITYSLTYTNATTTFSFTYSDPTNVMQQGCLRLTRRTINGDTVLNTTCQTSAATTILMNISDGAVGSNEYIAEAYAIIGGQTFSLDSLSVSFNNTYKIFGLSGIFFGLLIIIVLVMVGIWHPAVAIVMMIVGVIATNVMGIFYLNWVYIVTFVILGAITMYRVGKSD